jgi:uncharacterized protein YegL
MRRVAWVGDGQDDADVPVLINLSNIVGVATYDGQKESALIEWIGPGISESG